MSFRALEELPEAIETFFQHQAVARYPALHRVEVLRAEAAVSRPTHLLGADEARLLEDLHVLLQPREGDPERLGGGGIGDIAPPEK